MKGRGYPPFHRIPSFGSGAGRPPRAVPGSRWTSSFRFSCASYIVVGLSVSFRFRGHDFLVVLGPPRPSFLPSSCSAGSLFSRGAPPIDLLS